MKTDRAIRTFDVLELLSGHREGLRLTEISRALELPLSSAHHLLKAMVAAALVTHAEHRYRIGPRPLRLAIALGDSIAVRDVARRHLPALARTVGHDAYLALRVGDDVVYVDRFEGTHAVALHIRLGRRLYLHATSVGKLFAAFHEDLRAAALAGPLPKVTANTITDPDELDRALAGIRDAGVAITRGESVEGIRGFALPVRDPGDSVVAAVHLSVVEGPDLDDEHLVEAARSAVRAIEAELGVVDAQPPAVTASRRATSAALAEGTGRTA